MAHVQTLGFVLHEGGFPLVPTRYRIFIHGGIHRKNLVVFWPEKDCDACCVVCDVVGVIHHIVHVSWGYVHGKQQPRVIWHKAGVIVMDIECIVANAGFHDVL